MKDYPYVPSWRQNKDNNKPAINHSILMLTTHGIAEGEWDGNEWVQYRWSCKVKDTEVLYWIHLKDLSQLEKEGDLSLQQDKETLELCSKIWWEEQGWIMIPPNATIKGIDSLLKQVRKKLQQEQPDFPTTDEEVEKFLATHPKVEVPDKYKTSDWLWKKLERPEEDLEKASRNVYESWMGGSMDDVRRDMVELGKVLNARKEENK